MHKVWLIIVVVQVGIVKIYVTVVEVVKKNERGDETQFTTKGGKLSLGLSYFVCKISFPVMHLIACYAKSGHFWPLIAWLYRQFYYIYIKFECVYDGVCNCFRIKV